MKKVVLMGVLLVAAVAANAASFKWSASGITGYNTEDLYSGTATLYAYAVGGSAADAFAVNSATMSEGAILAADTVFSSDSLAGGSTYTFFYTMEDAAGNLFTSSLKTVRAQATATVPIGFASGGSWAAVPEPTSGVLLLLGMGALALRRKQK